MEIRLRRRRRRLFGSGERRFFYRVVDLVWPWFFGALVCLAAFVPARLYSIVVGNEQAAGWLRGWVVIVAVAGTLRLGFRILCSRDNRIQWLYETAPKPLHGLQYVLAGCLAGIFVFIIATSHFPRLYLWMAWPLFIPGIIIMVRRFSLNDRSGPFPRPVTRRALFYAMVVTLGLLWATFWMPVDNTSGLYAEAPAADSTFLDLLLKYVFPSGLAFGVLMGIYALMRQSDLARLQAEMVTRQFEKVIQQDNYTQFWPQVAKSIQQQFRLQRVVIITPDDHYHHALCAATEAQRTQYLSEVKFCIEDIAGEGSDGVETRDYLARGIALWVLNEARSRIVPDVARVRDEYYENGLKDTRSELYVPVLDLEHDGEVIAIIVAQDPHRLAFTRVDQVNMERVADYLATFSKHLNQNANYRRLQETAEKLESKTDVDQQDLLNAACAVFRTNCVAYIPLAFGTYRPILADIAIIPEGFPEPFVADETWLDARSGIPRQIRSWQPLLIIDFRQDEVARFWCDWASTHKLQALALVPIGAKSGSCALFVVGFRQSVVADERHLKTLLAAFANNLAPCIDHNWAQWWAYDQTFLAPTVEMHQLLNRYSLSRNSADTTITMAVGGDMAVLQQLCVNIKALIKDLYDMEAMSSPLDNEGSPLTRAVERFVNGLQARYSFSGIRQIDPRIEVESPELKTMLYRIICEAILNALGRGGANNVNVFAWRRRDCIMLLVHDNGTGFDPTCLRDQEQHRYGIIALCRRLSVLTGAAQPEWLWTAPRRGTCLKVCVPCLAVNLEDTPVDNDIMQKIKRLEELYGQPIRC